MSSNENTLQLDQLLAQAAWLRRLARSLLGDSGSAEDAVQATLLTALERPPREAGNIRGWFGTVLLNKVRGEARRRKVGASAVREADAPVAPTPEETIGNLQLQRQVASLLVELEPAVRQVVYLRYVEELDSSEIGRRLGEPAATVRWRLRSGIEQLRRALDDQDAKLGSKPGQWRRALVPFLPARLLERAPAVSLTAASVGPLPWIGALGMIALVGAGAGGYHALTRSSQRTTPQPAPTLSAVARADPDGSNRPGARPPMLLAVPASDDLRVAGSAAGPAGTATPPGRPLAPRRTLPYSAVHWSGEQMRVRIGNELVELMGIDGRPLAEIIAYAKKTYPGPPTLWRKRIGEDLVEVLSGMGRPASDPLPMQVRRLTVGSEAIAAPTETIEAPMTLANRSQVVGTNLASTPPLPSPVDPFARVSPFTGLVFQGEAIEVEVEGAWYRLVSIEGVPADKLVAVAKQKFSTSWRKRLAEDPAEVLTAALGQSPRMAVDLVLEEQGSGRRVERAHVPMTEQNRRRVKASWR